MDPSRIESYLRSTCSVLDFDIGELWCARKLSGEEPSLKFIQLYTSPTYEDFHSLLVQPETSSSDPNHGFGLDEDKHRFSPVICRGVCDGGHIVWANTRISEGLTGRTDLPLNTAVGVPICSIGNDLYILVLFAVGLISMTPQAVEYLTTIARAVTEGSEGFLSASFSNGTPVTPAKTEDFVGIWDINELVRKYGTEVEFHVFPVVKLQKFFDCHEILLFCDLFMDFKLTRDGRFTVKQLESLKETFRQTRERSDSLGSDTSKGWDIDDDFPVPSTELSHRRNKDTQAMVGTKNPFMNESDTSHGVYSADLNSLEIEETNLVDDGNSAEGMRRPRSVSMDNSGSNDVTKSILHIYAHMTYKLGQCRFHEFMIAVLGMTVFEASELWLVNEKKGELQLVAAVYRSVEMQKWIALSETLRLKIGVDLPGRVVDTGTSHWESDYAKSNAAESETDSADLRIKAAREYGVNVAFGVPLPGLRGICGSVVFYSSCKTFTAAPLLILLIEKAIHLMAMSSVDSTVFPKLPSPHQSSSDLLKTAAIAANANSSSNSQIFANRRRKSEEDLVNSTYRGNSTLVRGRSIGDFDQRLELCRTIVSSRTGEEATKDPLKQQPHPMARKRNSSGRLKQLGAVAAAAAAAEELGDVDGPSLPPGFMFTPVGGVGATNLPQSFYPPQVDLNAAFAVSQFGSAGWRNFIPGGYPDGNTPLYMQQYAAGSTSVPMMGSSQNFHTEHLHPNLTSTIPFVSMPMPPSHQQVSFRDPNSMHQHQQQLSYTYGMEQPKQQFLTTAETNNGADNSNAAHSNPQRCKMEGCTQDVESPGAQLCAAHRATRRCQKDGCNKCAQGATKFCIAHGGGRRCTFQGCEKGARDKFFCAAHGGGKRCSTTGCTKSAVGGSTLCTAHGGGKRCQYPGCQKSSQSSTHFCVRHGGGRTCAYPDCTKVARGKTDYCASHGGGVRCRVRECNKLAVGALQLCRAHTAQQNKNALDELLCMPISADYVVDDRSEDGDEDIEFREDDKSNDSNDAVNADGSKRQRIS